MRPRALPIGPGQESVWDYPRPPRLEPVSAIVRVLLAGQTVARTERGWRVLETSHPPCYYLPREDVLAELPVADGGSFCEWKGRAIYHDVVVPGGRAPRAAWSYPVPSPDFAAIAGHVAFYAQAMEACFVGEHRVTPQPGGFYGGWITPDIVGPFKGVPGSMGW